LPIDVLKSNNTGKGFRLSALRQVLVITQFVISVALIAATAIVYRQLNYLQQKDLGFDKDQLLVFNMQGDKMQQAYEQVKTELLRNPNILAASASYGEPGGLVAGDGIRLRGDKDNRPISMFTVDYDYIPTLKLQMVAGRPFSKNYKADEQQAYIINETAAKELGFGTPEKALGQEIIWDEWLNPDKLKIGKVVGVVKDFHYKSLHQKIEPFIMHVYPGTFNQITIRMRPDNMPATLAHLEKTWKTFAPEYPFEYNFLDEYFGKMVESERKLSQVFTIFAGLAIFIACLGLLGLVAFSAQQRTKEIGIRKVMGASVAQITLLLTKDFTKLVLIAILIATPIAWYAMHHWLQDFPYRITISPWIFLLAGFISLLFTLITVSYLAHRAASTNPIKSLRTE
ncbi:MAG: ABC transporter permease, partial [Adhaeribacter sp.]